MASSRRRLVGLLIVGFWLTMMGWLLWRQLGTSAAPGSGLVEVTDSWLAVELADGSPAGFVHLRRVPERLGGEPGARWIVTSRLDLRLLGRITGLELSASAWQPIDRPFQEIEVKVQSGEHLLRFEGGVHHGALEGTLHTAGEQIPLRFPVGQELLLGGGAGSVLTLPVLEPGEEILVDSFDATSFSTGKARLRCVGSESLTVGSESVETRVVTIDASGLSSKAWVDLTGEVVRAETPFGLVLRRITAREAMDLALGERSAPTEGTGGLLESTAIRPRGVEPRRGAKRLRLRIGGLEAGRIPEGEHQRRLGGREWEILTPDVGGSDRAETGPDDRGESLASDPFVQADHPRIRSRAERIVGEETGPWQRALRIYEWVWENVEKDVVLSVPSALDVLETLEGDCNEHTVLFTALARAAGLPTKIAIGIVWSRDAGGFYYHAWPEVWVGRWVKMDPTLGQPLADATHLKLLEGGIESWPQLLPYLGRLELEILEVE